MKLTCTGADLHRAAKWAAGIAGTNPQIPVLAGVLLNAEGDLSLSASDFETFGTTRVTAAVQQEGRALVSARLLEKIAGLDAVPAGDEVSLAADDSRLVIRCGRGTWKLPLMNLGDWPQFPQPGEPLGTVDAFELAKALKRVTPASDSQGETSVAALGGVLLELGEVITLTATDKYRVATTEITWQPKAEGTTTAIVPGDVLRHIVVDGDAVISGGDDAGIFSVESGRYNVRCRLLAGPFPKVGHIIDAPGKNAATLVVVDASELKRICDGVAVALGKGGYLDLEFADNAVAVTSVGEGDEAGDNSIDLTEMNGPPLTVAVRYEYISAALKSVDTDLILLTFTASRKQSFMLQQAGENGAALPGYRHIMMPFAGKGGKS